MFIIQNMEQIYNKITTRSLALLYKDFKESIRSLGFISTEDFMHYAGVTSNDILNWKKPTKFIYGFISFTSLKAKKKSCCLQIQP